MACDPNANGPCGSLGATPSPFDSLGAVVALLLAAVGLIKTIVAALDPQFWFKLIAVFGTSATAGAVVGFLAVVAVLALIVAFGQDRCGGATGPSRCLSGVVNHIEAAYDSVLSQIFPFSGQHTRVDVTVKSDYWPLAQEPGATYVWCTRASQPASVVFRCYYFTAAVCDAIGGALVGAVLGGAVGIVLAGLAAAAIIAAIGCAVVPLCVFAIILALIVAALVAGAAALVGALVGGQIAKAGDDTDPGSAIGPTAGGNTVFVGTLVSVVGTMEARNDDDGANVIWFVTSTGLHGMSMQGTPPFTHCDAEDQITPDVCVPIIL